MAFGNLPFEIEADHIKFTNKDKDFFATGNVVVNYKTYTIYSEETIFNQEKYTLTFNNGAKIVDSKDNELSAKTIVLNLNTDVGFIEHGQIKTNRNIFIKAKNISLSKKVIELVNCSLTSCTSKRPEWYLKSNHVNINRKNNLINTKQSTLYFYGLPIFYIPSFAQSVYEEEVTNRPTPEFGYNQIDKTYLNIYLGYLITNEIAGKAGVGISTERGFRYGATHIYTINKNNTLEFKTYNVEKTGFEGGAKYQWTKKHTKTDTDPLISSLLMTTNDTTGLKSELSIQYMYDNAYYNELYNALPEFRYGISNIQSFWNVKSNVSISTGYYEDRIYKDNRHQLILNFEKEILSSNKLTINNGINTNLIDYRKNNDSWQRIVNYLSFNFPLWQTTNKFTYSKLMYENGESPFVFDSINQLNQDEIGFISSIHLLPIIFSIEGDYQLNDKSFRNLKYIFNWVFQCWQLDFSIDTVWEEVNFGASIPLF